MKNFFLSPLFAAFFVCISLLLYFVISYIVRLNFGVFDIEKSGATEVLTYVSYGFAAGIVLCLYKDHIHTHRQTTYFALLFLWLTALLREMGIQHWLTTHDTTAIKIKFFTNPNNPLYEKIISASLVLLVLVVVCYLIFKYFKPMVVGFFKFKTIYWTIATFGVLTISTQFIDRFPANYVKATGTHLTEPVRFFLKIFEEGGESLLPLLFALAFVQFHFILHKKTSQNGGESKDTAPDSV